MYIYVTCTLLLLLLMYKQSIIVYWHASELGLSFFFSDYMAEFFGSALCQSANWNCLHPFLIHLPWYIPNKQRERSRTRSPWGVLQIYMQRPTFSLKLPFHFPHPAPKNIYKNYVHMKCTPFLRKKGNLSYFLLSFYVLIQLTLKKENMMGHSKTMFLKTFRFLYTCYCV